MSVKRIWKQIKRKQRKSQKVGVHFLQLCTIFLNDAIVKIFSGTVTARRLFTLTCSAWRGSIGKGGSPKRKYLLCIASYYSKHLDGKKQTDTCIVFLKSISFEIHVEINYKGINQLGRVSREA